MKLLTVNKTELIQDRLKIENEIGQERKKLTDLYGQIEKYGRSIEHKMHILELLHADPNMYMRMKIEQQKHDDWLCHLAEKKGYDITLFRNE